MKDVKKKLPEFKNEDEERNFWATADATEYLDWQAGKHKLVRLKPSLKTISRVFQCRSLISKYWPIDATYHTNPRSGCFLRSDWSESVNRTKTAPSPLCKTSFILLR
jgi:CopG antitoxin of type II toxin-antitoxin system